MLPRGNPWLGRGGIVCHLLCGPRARLETSAAGTPEKQERLEAAQGGPVRLTWHGVETTEQARIRNDQLLILSGLHSPAFRYRLPVVIQKQFMLVPGREGRFGKR